MSALPLLAENPAQQAECAEEDHNRGDDGQHQESDEEGAASAAVLLDEYLCRRLLRRWLSQIGAFSLRWVQPTLVGRPHLFGAKPHVAKSPADCGGRSIPIPGEGRGLSRVGLWIPVCAGPGRAPLSVRSRSG